MCQNSKKCMYVLWGVAAFDHWSTWAHGWLAHGYKRGTLSPQSHLHKTHIIGMNSFCWATHSSGKMGIKVHPLYCLALKRYSIPSILALHENLLIMGNWYLLTGWVKSGGGGNSVYDGLRSRTNSHVVQVLLWWWPLHHRPCEACQGLNRNQLVQDYLKFAALVVYLTLLLMDLVQEPGPLVPKDTIEWHVQLLNSLGTRFKAAPSKWKPSH